MKFSQEFSSQNISLKTGGLWGYLKIKLAAKILHLLE
jgi:hypothetical protein